MNLSLSSLGLRLLGQKHGLDVGEHTTLGNGDAGQKLVQLLVVADGKLKMTGDDSGLLVVTGSVSSQLEDFSGEVLEHGGQVHWGTGSHTLGVVSFAEKSVDTSNRELKSSSAGARLGLSLNFSSLSTSRHDELFSVSTSTTRNIPLAVFLAFLKYGQATAMALWVKTPLATLPNGRVVRVVCVVCVTVCASI